MSDRVHDELVALLREHVKTYEHLEVLLLLASDQARAWNADDVVAALCLEPASVRETLEHLTEAGLLRHTSDGSDGKCRCHPSWARILDYLVETHRDDRMELVALMTRNALDRVRDSAHRTFGSAFVSGRKSQAGSTEQ